MDIEVAEFYEDKGLGIPKLIARGPRELSPTVVEAAATQVYYDIMNGLEVKDISLARHVWSVAKSIDGREYIEKKRQADAEQKGIDAYKAHAQEESEVLRRRTVYYQRLLAGTILILIALSAYIGWM